MHPRPQAKPKLQPLDDRPHTLVDIVNPSILLIGQHPNLEVLLSRNTLIDPHTIRLRGARLITIPLGWRLALIRVMSRWTAVRLPDEREFDVVDIDTWKAPAPLLADEVIIGEVQNARGLIQLTGSEYRALCDMPGRELHRWINEHFGIHDARGLKRKGSRAA